MADPRDSESGEPLRYRVARFDEIAGVPCPCGEARRAFGDDPERLVTSHVVEISAAARTHYHRRQTEVYYVLEGEGQIELDGESQALTPGMVVLIKPGCRHRALPASGKRLRILNTCIPAFDPADEHFD